MCTLLIVGAGPTVSRSASPVHKQSKNIQITVQHIFLSLSNKVTHHYMIFSFTACNINSERLSERAEHTVFRLSVLACLYQILHNAL